MNSPAPASKAIFAIFQIFCNVQYHKVSHNLTAYNEGAHEIHSAAPEHLLCSLWSSHNATGLCVLLSGSEGGEMRSYFKIDMGLLAFEV